MHKNTYGHINNINSLINLNDETIVSCSSDKTIKIWDLINDECIKTLQGHSQLIRNVIKLNDGSIASCSMDETIKIWRI